MDGEPGDVPGRIDPMRIIFYGGLLAVGLWLAHSVAPALMVMVGLCAVSLWWIDGQVQESDDGHQ